MNLRDKSPDGNPSTFTIALPPLVIPTGMLAGLAPQPVTVSQYNVRDVFGIPKRTFLELLRRADAPTVTKIGQLRLVDRVEFLAWLRSLAAKGSPKARLALVKTEPELDGADAVLAELGLERVGGAR